ncbi:MAG: hypothetical protein WD599_04095 [Balneolaceae bacterium]
MGEEVYIVAIVFGSIITIVTLSIIGSIIKSWVKNRNSESIVNDEDFLEALREFKEKTDRRLSKLESLLSDKNKNVKNDVSRNEKSVNIDSGKADEENPSGQNLKNMLKNR